MTVPLERDDLLWHPDTGPLMFVPEVHIDRWGRRTLSPDAHLLLQARTALQLTCGDFEEPDLGPKRAAALLLWLLCPSGTLSGVARRIFRECPNHAVQDVVLDALDSLPDGIRYDLAGTLRFDPPGSDAELEFRRRLHAVNDIRASHGQPRLGVPDQERLLAALGSAHEGYWNHCWRCEATVEEGFNAWCPECGWLICLCGACRDPRWGECSRERR